MYALTKAVHNIMPTNPYLDEMGKQHLDLHAFLKLNTDLYIILEQAIAYQKTLQTMETTMKQQQEFTNRTVRDLKDKLSRLSIESAQQEQLTLAVRVDRDRLIREQQAKVF